jgi:hypothetical protein
MPNGYADATANLVPVLPPMYAAGRLAAPADPAKPRRVKPLRRRYQSLPPEDSFTREMPAGFEGLVFSSVVLSA